MSCLQTYKLIQLSRLMFLSFLLKMVVVIILDTQLKKVEESIAIFSCGIMKLIAGYGLLKDWTSLL